jgi:hypothetical protein
MSTEANKKVNLDLTPEEALSGGEIRSEEDHEALQAKIKAMSNVPYPFVDVWEFQCALAWMIWSEDGSISHVERSMKWEQEKLGVTDDMLFVAVKKAGGTISRSGHYPISDEIKAKLERAA